ncbi:hypothetical protein os1_38340 [Comamonadaceae bacterium OS-1]|nr:hypothetical protein os1_38340 [Comamonadaceae bacterium OS-1]
MSKTEVPTPEAARKYVSDGIHGVGGLREAAEGLRYKTLPTFMGKWSSLTLVSVFALLVRVGIVCLAALFPILVKKLAMPPVPGPGTNAPASMQDAFGVIVGAIQTATSMDYFLGVVAIVLVGVPKLLDMFGKESRVGHHTPFMDLTAAIRQMPVKDKASLAEMGGAIRLTLLALREEMSLLIDARTSSDVTDVALLEFCDADGARMQVRARTANHEELNRPNDAPRFVAYYVAQEGRNFAEHNFTNKRNPFPAKRVSVRGAHDVNYRSVLYMPMMVSVKSSSEAKDQPEQIVDYCVGVICVHSSKPYRFWRWGDHKKGTGGFADVAFSRALPYIAIIEQLLSRTAYKVKLEVK